MRQEKRRSLHKEIRDLKKAIKEKCKDCLCNQRFDCGMPECSLYRHRGLKINSDE